MAEIGRLPARQVQETENESADFAGALSVTTRSITPIPVPFAARSTVAPDGLPALVGRMQVDLAAHRAVIETTVTFDGAGDLQSPAVPVPAPVRDRHGQ